jgi:hypothetical protein
LRLAIVSMFCLSAVLYSVQRCCVHDAKVALIALPERPCGSPPALAVTAHGLLRRAFGSAVHSGRLCWAALRAAQKSEHHRGTPRCSQRALTPAAIAPGDHSPEPHIQETPIGPLLSDVSASLRPPQSCEVANKDGRSKEIVRLASAQFHGRAGDGESGEIVMEWATLLRGETTRAGNRGSDFHVSRAFVDHGCKTRVSGPAVPRV